MSKEAGFRVVLAVGVTGVVLLEVGGLWVSAFTGSLLGFLVGREVGKLGRDASVVAEAGFSKPVFILLVGLLGSGVGVVDRTIPKRSDPLWESLSLCNSLPEDDCESDCAFSPCFSLFPFIDGCRRGCTDLPSLSGVENSSFERSGLAGFSRPLLRSWPLAPKQRKLI